MKTVVNTGEVSHLWAHQVQPHAKNSTGSLYFRDDTIYSYGRHFPIARHVECNRRRGVLFTDRTYSVTTTGHCSIVRSAIPPGVPVLIVNDPTLNRGQGRDWFIKQVASMAAKIVGKRKGRSQQKATQEWAIVATRANRYFAFFGYAKRYNISSEAVEVLEAYETSVRLEQKKTERVIKSCMERFRRGQIRYIPFDHEPLLRVENDTVVTSLGAVVPLAHVVKVMPLVLRVIESGNKYERNGNSIHLGHYVVDSIDTKGTLHAGCHHIPKDEIFKLAQTLDTI